MELAPHHKTGLALTSPLIAGGGAFGFADEYASLVDFSKFGAFITNPITLKPRSPAREQRVIQFAGGVLIHTGWANPGLSHAIKKKKKKWERLGCPVIVHLACDSVDDVEECMEKIDRVEVIAGVEIGFRDEEETVNVEAMIKAATRIGGKPVIVQVPRSRAIWIARVAERSGAQSISISLPRGTMKHNGEWVSGRLYGAALLPQTIHLLREIKTQTSLPIIGAGGVHSKEDVDVLLEAGASAVQIDSLAWVAPDVLNGIRNT
ncbi:MAG: glycerol-3-phosphate responsive antiterminator [Chloroflexi bacterium]|nr:glycerol-3-phosphate responsive antiterminator [Chloroflexota bacterium]